jgi:hypothetical protein
VQQFLRDLTHKDENSMKNTSEYQLYLTISWIGLLSVVFVSCAAFPPPTEQIAVSKVAISNANNAGGNEFASAEMRAAQDKLDRAVQAMTAEDYKNAKLLAEQAQVDAQLATAKAGSAKAQKAADTVQEDSHILRKEIDRKSQ